MKRFLTAIALTASITAPLNAAIVQAKFSPGNYCGEYLVKPEDILALRVTAEQLISVEKVNNVQRVTIHQADGVQVSFGSDGNYTSTYYTGTYFVAAHPYDAATKKTIKVCVLPENLDGY